jgi:hypothetical protein
LPGLVLTQPSASSSKASLKCFHCLPCTSIMRYIKDSFKVKFFPLNLHSTFVLCVTKFKIKSEFKVHIKAKHKRQLSMLCFNVDLDIRFYFAFAFKACDSSYSFCEQKFCHKEHRD